MAKTKNNIRINGTNFNKAAVSEMEKAAFVKMHLNDEVFRGSKDREKQLGDAYDLITGAKDKAPVKK